MMDGTKASATALYIDSIKQGVTTVFDHHASYGEIPGTLHTIAEESKRLGLRSCLCYEVSDRDGEEKCLQAIKENHGMRAAQGSHARGDVRRSRALHHLR